MSAGMMSKAPASRPDRSHIAKVVTRAYRNVVHRSAMWFAPPGTALPLASPEATRQTAPG